MDRPKLANLLQLMAMASRQELEELMRRLKLEEGGLDGSGKGEGTVAMDGKMRCILRYWPTEAEASLGLQHDGIEVIRVVKGRLTLSEHYCTRGRLEPYCVTELVEGSVASLHAGIIYSIRNRSGEKACTLHVINQKLR